MVWILIGYMFLFIHRPFEVWPFLGDLHVERIYMIGAMIAVALHAGKRWLPNWQHLAYAGFAAAVVVCWVVSPWADKGETTVENWFKVLVFYVLLVVVVRDERSLKRVLVGFLVVMALYMAHSLREYLGGRASFRMGIYRMLGVDTSLGDPNSFGASIVYALPFVLPFWSCRPSPLLRWLLGGYVGLSILCITLTGSRSSFLGLMICAAAMMLRSRYRWRWVALGVLASPLLWFMMPDSLQNRFETIINPSAGSKDAMASADGRWAGVIVGLELFNQYPLTGCGPGAWKAATGRVLESHQLYGQLLGEMGGAGAVAFGGVVAGFWWNLRKIRQAYGKQPGREQDFPYQVSRAVGLAVVMMLIVGLFGHSLFRFNWLWYGGFLIIARHCVEQRLAAPAWQARVVRAPRPQWRPALPRYAWARPV